MHIPDGFLSPPVAIATGIASAAVIAAALNRTRDSIGLRQAPIVGLTTAFVFAAQMINFPVAGGTSGHLLGGALASVVLGSPWAATLAMSTVFIIQSVLFADGGITALGANIFNMGLVGIWVGWWLLQPLQGTLGRFPKSFAASCGNCSRPQHCGCFDLLWRLNWQFLAQ